MIWIIYVFYRSSMDGHVTASEIKMDNEFFFEYYFYLQEYERMNRIADHVERMNMFLHTMMYFKKNLKHWIENQKEEDVQKVEKN